MGALVPGVKGCVRIPPERLESPAAVAVTVEVSRKENGKIVNLLGSRMGV